MKLKQAVATCGALALIFSQTISVSAANLGTVFDATYYANTNPDVKAAYGYDTSALFEHYKVHGIKEGRIGSLLFHWEKYRNLNPDLKNAFGNDAVSYVYHYLNYGIKEGRDAGGDFDAISYANRYPDLKAAFGYNPEALYKHYLEFGMKEGRNSKSEVVVITEKKLQEERIRKAAAATLAARQAEEQEAEISPSISSPVPENKPTITPPATDDSTTTPPTTDDGTTTPPTTDDGTTTPPTTDDGTTTPPATDDGTTTPPATDDSTTTPPATDDGTTTPPATDDGTTTPPATDDGTTTPPATDDGTTTPPTTEKPSVDTSQAYIQEVVNLVNEERAKEGLGSLSLDAQVQAASMIRAQELETLFDHNRPNGTSCYTALDEQGVSYTRAAENIAKGQSSPTEVMNSWMNSEGHRKNILTAELTHIGVGYYVSSNGTAHWVQLFIGK